MNHYIGQKIFTGTDDEAEAAAVGDTRMITAYPGIDLAAYRITKIDKDRGLIYGVITATAEHGIIPTIT